MCAYTLSHPHHPSPHTNILASLVKGEVLSPEKIRATTGGIALRPPASPSPQPSQKDNNPSLRTMSSPPLSKVRCCRQKKFGRLPEGLPHRPSPSPQPSQNTCQPFAPHHHPRLINALPFPIPPHQNSPSSAVLASGITTTPPSFSSSSTTPPSHS